MPVFLWKAASVFTFNLLCDGGLQVLLGYGWAGILRRYLVDPVDMWWPSNFAQVSLFRAMIQGEASIKKVVVVCGESGSHEPSYEKNKNLHEDGGDGERPSPEGEEGVEEDEEHA
ncbi:uncharacterized protein LOC107619234 [Arachis ipaensis]|uniref:uncharacterized protein LOC107619234 n=1 Tax=Arachis ipaensis TaxID=130454 RepID=UPI000A2B2D16|nr:uncharacterized protein LOC107619234 [Arachis ipaensis]XP_025629375.1 uncharacterized protein LOC112722531 isoform X2 [Arachis hypogaea]QHO20635.1 Oligopeptide transporter [Arachis hypogaea]